MRNFSRLHPVSDLQAFARQKVEAEQRKRIAALPSDIKALQRKLAAKGLFNSGAMLKQVLATCQQTVTEQGKTIVTEYRWAIGQALFASQSWVERLVKDATASIAPLYEESVAHVTRSTEIIGMPQLIERLIGDLKATRATVEDDIALALRSAFAEKRRDLIRSLPSTLLRFLSKPFSGGGA